MSVGSASMYNYKNKRNTASVPSAYSPPKKRLRNILSTDLNWKDNCFICGKEADEMKEDLRKKIHHVTNAVFKETVLDLVQPRKEDLCREVHRRVSGVIDLMAVEARHHADCYTGLRDESKRVGRKKKIRPQILQVDAAIDQNFQYIEENDDCQFSFQELRNILSTEHIH
jgi:hypothetical protein